MRLWHYMLIPYLPHKQLLSQHRECCALRGNGWGRKHEVVNYVFRNPFYRLYVYHLRIINEMINRGFKVDGRWQKMNYRGKVLGFVNIEEIPNTLQFKDMTHCTNINYPEHNDLYLTQCIANLQNKKVQFYKDWSALRYCM